MDIWVNNITVINTAILLSLSLTSRIQLSQYLLGFHVVRNVLDTMRDAKLCKKGACPLRVHTVETESQRAEFAKCCNGTSL